MYQCTSSDWSRYTIDFRSSCSSSSVIYFRTGSILFLPHFCRFGMVVVFICIRFMYTFVFPHIFLWIFKGLYLLTVWTEVRIDDKGTRMCSKEIVCCFVSRSWTFMPKNLENLNIFTCENLLNKTTSGFQDLNLVCYLRNLKVCKDTDNKIQHLQWTNTKLSQALTCSSYYNSNTIISYLYGVILCFCSVIQYKLAILDIYSNKRLLRVLNTCVEPFIISRNYSEIIIIIGKNYIKFRQKNLYANTKDRMLEEKW